MLLKFLCQLYCSFCALHSLWQGSFLSRVKGVDQQSKQLRLFITRLSFFFQGTTPVWRSFSPCAVRLASTWWVFMPLRCSLWFFHGCLSGSTLMRVLPGFLWVGIISPTPNFPNPCLSVQKKIGLLLCSWNAKRGIEFELILISTPFSSVAVTSGTFFSQHDVKSRCFEIQIDDRIKN